MSNPITSVGWNNNQLSFFGNDGEVVTTIDSIIANSNKSNDSSSSEKSEIIDKYFLISRFNDKYGFPLRIPNLSIDSGKKDIWDHLGLVKVCEYGYLGNLYTTKFSIKPYKSSDSDSVVMQPLLRFTKFSSETKSKLKAGVFSMNVELTIEMPEFASKYEYKDYNSQIIAKTITDLEFSNICKALSRFLVIAGTTSTSDPTSLSAKDYDGKYIWPDNDETIVSNFSSTKTTKNPAVTNPSGYSVSETCKIQEVTMKLKYTDILSTEFQNNNFRLVFGWTQPGNDTQNGVDLLMDVGGSYQFQIKNIKILDSVLLFSYPDSTYPTEFPEGIIKE